MHFEFLVTYRAIAETEVRQILVELLAKVLEDNLVEIEMQAVEQMITIRHERVSREFNDNQGVPSKIIILCFSVDLSEGTQSLDTIIQDFAALLSETAPIFHAVKFEDPLLHSELLRYAEEIFVLEMKLRRVLTFIYLNANGATNPYDLLSDETVQPVNKEKPHEAQMKAAVENQFFYLTFGQYVALNNRPEFKQVSALLEVVRDSLTYDDFRSEINRLPIEYEDDAVFVAGLKEKMDAIEAMRNCVAHNRTPSRKVTDNYKNACPLLDQLLDEFLDRWEPAAPVADPSLVAAPEDAILDASPISEIAASQPADGTANAEESNPPPSISEGPAEQ